MFLCLSLSLNLPFPLSLKINNKKYFLKNIITVLFSSPFSAASTNTFESSEKGEDRDDFHFLLGKGFKREPYGIALFLWGEQPNVPPTPFPSENPLTWRVWILGNLSLSFFAHQNQDAEKEACAKQGFLTLQILQCRSEMEDAAPAEMLGGRKENTEEKLDWGGEQVASQVTENPKV